MGHVELTTNLNHIGHLGISQLYPWPSKPLISVKRVQFFCGRSLATGRGKPPLDNFNIIGKNWCSSLFIQVIQHSNMPDMYEIWTIHILGNMPTISYKQGL